MQLEFNANKRDGQGTGASRRLRRTGRVPGIIYGGSAKPQQIDIDHNELFQLLRKEAFYSSVLNANVEGAKEMCLLRDVQRHPYRPVILHVDFQRVDATHKIHQKVPLHFINADIAPGVKLGGGMVSHVMNDVDVKCLPGDLPAFIEVDLKDLASGNSIHVSQLVLPKGVEVAHHGEGDPVVATIMMKGGSAVEEAEAAPVVVAPAAAAPAKKAERVDKR
ncbi:MAG: 50S ribosomal protein L25/general stress protein Ctc [Sterolibacteriaceae bacterium]|uniref:50S ribosomal protein L25/general stress protein Ctc n=1 Tax=Sulfuritalea sp. TaxID=2480090 RepID=UPI001A5133BA|nr:50S ribosomal protein L25/general stress protein Ctc [Sulfuritalea sp.]MBL8477811.1 50S ribosomal protein L25/general stress protein Ctc [Sterolibacteriaceae bacterium]MBN8474002.1 50S ribosomal protein L25/general stress protein Ctc [Sulfuritalea sp.]